MHSVCNTNNSKIAAIASVFTLTFLIVAISTSNAVYGQVERTNPFMKSGTDFVVEPKAPMAASQDGNNVYIVWWTNKSENWEVMFRASNDGGQTFGDKINLSNSSDTESQNAEMVAAGNNVFVSWWETSPETGSSESVLRVSNDAGQTFGPLIMLGVNGTISTTTGNTTESTTTTLAEQGEEQSLPNEELVPTEEET